MLRQAKEVLRGKVKVNIRMDPKILQRECTHIFGLPFNSQKDVHP